MNSCKPSWDKFNWIATLPFESVATSALSPFVLNKASYAETPSSNNEVSSVFLNDNSQFDSNKPKTASAATLLEAGKVTRIWSVPSLEISKSLKPAASAWFVSVSIASSLTDLTGLSSSGTTV